MYDFLIFVKIGEVLIIRQRGKVVKNIEKNLIIRMVIVFIFLKVKGYEYEDVVNICFVFGGFDSIIDFNFIEYIICVQFVKFLMDVFNIYFNYYNFRIV